MRGEPLDWNYTREYEPPPPVGHLQDSELDQAYARIVGRLAARGVVVKYLEPVPVRLRYEALRREVMETAFEYLPPRIHCVLNGCGGECIDCFQAPWCDLADIDDEPDEENL
jgi:hypothetical protein